MQSLETQNEGLKRADRITIPAADIEARIDAEVKKIAPQVKMPGFRPGKVPANLVKKMHRDSLTQEALNTVVQQGIDKTISDNRLRPATQPHVHLDHDYAPGKDAAVDFHLEVLPEIAAPTLDGIELERLTVEPTEADVQERIDNLLSSQTRFEPADKAADEGDAVVIDFVGKVDGVAFDGGTGEAMTVRIGQGQLIPGFEEQLVGMTAGEERQIKVTFPADYGAKELAGKDATFDIKATEVRIPADTKADDDFAKGLGLESMEQLTGLLKGQIEQELNGLTRTHMKRQLLDRLAATHDFDVPPSMVEAEFAQIWQQLEQEAAREEDPEAARAEMETEKVDYRAIAVRRVRLGLLLSEIGQANGIEVSNQEMNMLVAQAAQQYPREQQERFVAYVRENPMAAAQLRAPLFEDKVVDYLFDKAAINERTVTREELEAAIEAEPDGEGEEAKAKPAKKTAAKKPAKEAAAEGDAKPARKPAAKKAAKSESSDAEAGSADAASDDAVAAKPKKPRAPKKADADEAVKPAAKKAPAKKAAAKSE